MNTINHEDRVTATRSALLLIIVGGFIGLIGFAGNNKASIFLGGSFSVLSLICLYCIYMMKAMMARLFWGFITPILLYISPLIFPVDKSLALVTYGYLYIGGMLYVMYSFHYDKERLTMWVSVSLFFVGMMAYDKTIRPFEDPQDGLTELISQNYLYFKFSQAFHFLSLVGLMLIIKHNKARIQKKMSLHLAKMSGLTSGLVEISQNHLVHSGDLLLALKEIIRFVGTSLDLSRISIWEFDENNNAILLVLGYDGLTKEYFHSAVLNRANYPSYFNALLKDKMINAYDAKQDAKTKEFNETYLIPNKIRSMMDSPFFLDGQFKGILCYEEQRYKKKWDEVDQLFSMCVSKLISISYYCQIRQNQYDIMQRTNEELELKNATLESINEKVVDINDDNVQNINTQDQGTKELKSLIDDLSFRNSHHLRAPLSRILGLVKLYKYEPKEDGREFYIDMIEKSAEELDQIVREIARTLRETRGIS